MNGISREISRIERLLSRKNQPSSAPRRAEKERNLEQQNTPYPPIMRAPLKMRGVFGLSWQLYKRGFWPMFAFAFLLVGMFLLILMLVMFSTFEKTGALTGFENGMSQFGASADSAAGTEAVASMLSFMGMMWLVSLAYSFLVTPAYLGATFLEMDQRMDGRSGTLYQLLRYALPIGFKRFYTTFLSTVLVQIIASIVITILISVVFPLMMFSALASSMANPVGGAGLAWVVVIGYIIMAVFMIIDMIFISLIYPAAAHEGKRAFQAVGRAFRLSSKRFGRLFGAFALFTLFLIISSVVCVLPTVLLEWHNITLTMIVNATCMCLWTSLLSPYYPAFCTALYVDAAARVPNAPAAPMQPQA